MSEPLVLIPNLKPRQRPLPVRQTPLSPPAAPVPAPASATTYRGVSFVLLGCWALLLSVDTIWADRVPRLNLLRLAVPLLLVAMLVLERTVAGARFHPGFRWWLICLALAGSLSSLLGLSLVLGMLKLAIYLSILVPLCLSHWVRLALSPGAAGMGLMAAFALAVLASSAGLIPFTGTGVFDNPNKLGAFAVATWPALELLRLRTGRLPRVLGTVGLGLCALVCVLMLSRGAIVALGCAWIAYIALRHRPTIGSVSFAVAAAVLFGSLMLLLNEPLKSVAYKGREQLLDNTRQAMFRETLYVWQFRPILGYGFGLSWTLSPEDERQVLLTGRMSWFTVEFGNSTLAMLSGGGVTIALLFYGIIGLVLRRVIHALRFLDLDSQRRAALSVLAAGIIGMLAHAQAEAWLMAPLTSMTLVFWLYVVVADSLSRTVR